MAMKTMRTKLTAIITAVALMLGLSFGNINILNTSALAEENVLQAAETEADPQPSVDETVSGETEETDQQDAESNEESAAGLQAAEEAAVPDEEPVPQDAEMTDMPDDEAGDESIPQASESEEAGQADSDEALPESGSEPEPEESEEVQPEPPSGDDSHDTADSEDEEEQIVIDDEDSGDIEEEILEPFNNLELYEHEAFIGTAEIRLMNDGMLGYGDEIVLRADVRDVNLNYRLVWEANSNDGRGWLSVGSGEEYRFILTQDNAECEYRVIIFAVD